jgi:hypothetical protein
MSNNTKNNRSDWIIPGFERSCKKAEKGFVISAIVLLILIACYLATLNIIYNYLSVIPAFTALFCLGYQRALIKADDYIQDYASQVALIIETQLSEEHKSGPSKSL